jgi:hypothetical protein
VNFRQVEVYFVNYDESIISQKHASKTEIPNLAILSLRGGVCAFAIVKYSFDDEQFQADRYQISIKTHKTIAKEFINTLPIEEVEGDTVMCTAVNQLSLRHPVQYIQLNRKN